MEPIVIEGALIPSAELRTRLLAELPADGIQLELVPKRTTRGLPLDPTVLTAIISGTSAAVSALVTGLMQVMGRRQERGKIVIRLDDGSTLEIPSGTPPEEISRYIEAAKGLRRVEELRLITSPR
jgi:hypothetical protein